MPLSGNDSDARRQAALDLLNEWRKAVTIAEGYAALHDYQQNKNSKFLVEVTQREVDDLRMRILELMGFPSEGGTQCVP